MYTGGSAIALFLLAPFKYVLEVKGGFCDINRVDIGNAVIFDI